MNQAELVDAASAECGQTKTVVNDVLSAVAAQAIKALRAGDDVALPHLGKLKSVQRAARTARNPRTGETVEVPAKTTVKFAPAKDLRDAMPKPKKK